MRCLYCGKELPLLKRFGSSEFCSDAHRNQYQKEYTELALNRLMQAKQPQQQKNSAKPVTTPTAPLPPAEPAPRAIAPPQVTPKPIPVIATKTEAVPTQHDTKDDPPSAGLFEDVKPTPAQLPDGFIAPDIEFIATSILSQPSLRIKEGPASLPAPGSVRTSLSVIAGEIQITEGKVEAREFARAVPILRWTARPEWGPERQIGQESKSMQVQARMPENSPTLWCVTAIAFRPMELELGEMEEESSTANPSSPHKTPLIRRSLSLLYSGIAPSKGRPVQVFSSALANDASIEVPTMKAIPLRPVMLLQNKTAVSEGVA